MKIEVYPLLMDNEFIITGKGKPLQVISSDVLDSVTMPVLHWLVYEGDSKNVLQVKGYRPGEEVYAADIDYSRDHVPTWQYINTTNDKVSWFWKVG